MSKFKVSILGRAERLQYTTEDGKILVIYADLRDGEVKLKDIRHWEQPYEDEEMSLEKKQEILNNIVREINTAGDDYLKVNINISPESNIIHYDEIFNYLASSYNLTRNYENGKEIEKTKFNEMSSNYKNDLPEGMSYLFREYSKLNEKEMIKFKEKMSNNIGVQLILLDFAKWKVNENLQNIDQKYFNYGLYALDMVLTENNKEEVQKVIEQYKNAAKEKNLSFNEFLQRNRPLNELINKN